MNTNNNTIEKMRKMKFFGMLKAFKASLEDKQHEKYSADEMISHLIETEYDERQNRNIAAKTKNAKFRYKASVEEIVFDDTRNLNRNELLRFADCGFISAHENILITGSTGVGKSYLASALGHQACSLGYRVLYQNTPKLFSRLKMAKADGTYLREIAKFERQHLLILDDFGLQPLDAPSRSSLMEIIEDRYGKGSIIITSQVPIAKWYEVIGEKTVADAILDRIIHSAHRLELSGESMRKKRQTVTEINKN